MARDHLPAFLSAWTFDEGDDTPLYSLNHDTALQPVIAAQWLYAPDFAEYRGGVFRVSRPVGLSDRYRAVLDARFDDFDGEIAAVEGTVNTLDVYGMFASCDLRPYEDDLDDLVITLGRTWKALLAYEFPERAIEVWAWYGPEEMPQVTFFQSTPTFTPHPGAHRF